MRRRMLLIVLSITGTFLIGLNGQAQNKPIALSELSEGQTLHGFKTTALYLNDQDLPMGARFTHINTGFTLTLLQIESVPQTFIYVNTFPVSDKGEPHTQEHLLITKGNKGHALNTREGMSLAQSNAFTEQLHTVYLFNTGAGPDVFYTLFEKYLDALLYPDYTDEEVRREVRNWGVVTAPDNTLRLEEKGSVYNEMYTTMTNPYALAFDTLGRLLYGNAHPISYNAGGLPAGIRVLNEKDIARYHQQNYYLGNMGAITSLPKHLDPGTVLDRMNRILIALSRGSHQGVHPMKPLPLPKPAKTGTIAVIDVPTENAQQPGLMVLAYPPELHLNAREYLELSNFLSVFAGDASTNLYKLFVDSRTRKEGVDAQSVYGWIDDKQLYPVFFMLDGVKSENLNAEKAALARQRIMQELEKVAAYPDHSPELIAFNKRYENSLISAARAYAKFGNSPPKFGFRNTGDDWYVELGQLDKVNGFKKPIGLKPQIQEIRDRMATGKNIWKEDIASWKLTTVLPYVLVTRSNPALNGEADSARKARADEEVRRLKSQYHLTDDQQTIQRYKSYYDSNTLVLEKKEQSVRIRFIDNPPLTLDDELNFTQEKLPGGIPVVASRFNNMTSATTGLALNLHGVPKDQFVYLALLPELLTETGYIREGKAVSYEVMLQQIQEQILSLNSYFSTSEVSDRNELVIEAAGNNEPEALLAVDWINRVLYHPYWEMENLPRMRDLVEQQLTSIRKKMQDAEETWVGDPDKAYENQDKPLYLATSSFLTRAHNIFRLKWMLKETGGSKDSAAISDFFVSLAQASTSRPDLTELLQLMSAENPSSPDSIGKNKSQAEAFVQLPAGAKGLAREAALDLLQTLNDIPDGSLAADWKYLCLTLQHDLAQGPANTLKYLNALRESLFIKTNGRLFLIGSEKTERSLQPAINTLVEGLANRPAIIEHYSTERQIDQRVKQRMSSPEPIIFVGLINPDSHTGVFENSAPLVGYQDTQRVQLLKYLAAQLFAGGGKQSVYTKTIGAGLSYSTGVYTIPSLGKFAYYAERTPELPQTLSFVINDIKTAPPDSTILDYLVSLAIGHFRSADDYESRGKAMAIDLADGLNPETIRHFRRAILKLRKEPGLIEAIYPYKNEVYEKILPGYGIPSKEVTGGSFFVIGPEKQMQAYEAYLKATNGPDTRLYRLYPRDFWITGP